MSEISVGSNFQHWKIREKRGEGAGYVDFLAEHDFLQHEALLRTFAPEFNANSDLGKALRHFLKSLAATTHPAIPSVLDVGTVSNPDGSESPYLALDSRSATVHMGTPLSKVTLNTREVALPFLYAMARFLLDAQSLRLGCDFLGPEDIAWDGTRIQFRTLRWVAIFEEGKLPSQHGSLFGAWEKVASSGIYPVPEDRVYPRVPSLVCLGRLMYQAAGIPNPVEQVQLLKQEGAEVSAHENTRSQLLVEGWGCALEALVRRSLFAYDPGMLENGEALLDATEQLMKGEVPELCRYVPVAPTSVQPTAPRSAVPSATALKKAQQAELPVSEATRKKTTVEAEKQEESPRQKTAPPFNGSSGTSLPASPAAKPFVPLGMEAAMLDTKTSPVSLAAPRKARRRKAISLPAIPAQTLRNAGLGLGAVIVLVLLVWGAMALFGRNGSGSNQPPVAVVAPLEGIIKRFQDHVLDGSGSSDPDQDSLIYQWTVIEPERADCSIAKNNSKAAQKTTIKFFQAGRHVIQLRVFDGKKYSEPVRLEINVQ